MVLDYDIELRRLAPGVTFELIQMLECGESWKQLMAFIPKEDEAGKGNDTKYNIQHMKLIVAASEKQRRSCSEIFLEEWGTSGRNLPRLSTLLSLLVKAQLYRAADFVAVQLLKTSPPKRPICGPAAAISIPETTKPACPTAVRPLPQQGSESATLHDNCSEQETQFSLQLCETALIADCMPKEHSVLSHVSYSILDQATGGFADSLLIGGGAFGAVYRAELSTSPFRSQIVAIKRLIEQQSTSLNPTDQFRNELTTLSRLSHPNLLPLLGHSSDGPAFCLIYQFMPHGSLHDRLACLNATQPLSWERRLRIASGAAEGILHIHSYLPKPLIHRDIKSANILLSSTYIPKLGDFGLVRAGSSGEHSQSVAMTTTVFGTSAYMAPEAFRGDVSAKMDVFSYGVVLLELLTGLPPYDENREGCDLTSHVDEIDDITKLLDSKAGVWPEIVVQSVYKLALQCLEEKKRRPTIRSVLEGLISITV